VADLEECQADRRFPHPPPGLCYLFVFQTYDGTVQSIALCSICFGTNTAID
jgi:hypothetical protein